MAIKDFITLGIGVSPDDITPFVLTGLSASPAAFTETSTCFPAIAGAFGIWRCGSPIGAHDGIIVSGAPLGAHHGPRYSDAALGGHAGSRIPAGVTAGHRGKRND